MRKDALKRSLFLTAGALIGLGLIPGRSGAN
jgi:hypothetical protein